MSFAAIFSSWPFVYPCSWREFYPFCFHGDFKMNCRSRRRSIGSAQDMRGGSETSNEAGCRHVHQHCRKLYTRCCHRRYSIFTRSPEHILKPRAIEPTSRADPLTPCALNTAAPGVPPKFKLLVGTGFCGSFTTFSTFSVDVVDMLRKKKLGEAVCHVLANNVGSMAAAAGGMMLVSKGKF